MHRRVQTTIWLIALFVVAATAATGADLPPLPFACDCETSLYAPQEEHFRGPYDADTENRKEQDWDDYWYWVQVFYDAQRCKKWPIRLWCAPGVKGWTLDAEATLDCAGSDEATRAELRPLINRVGWHMASEWSKDNGVRLISSEDLKSWGERMKVACGGGADSIRNELRWLAEQVAGQLP